ncbi:MAG: orotidine-5'-phosphate decarboxylase [Candidatus Levyibacteriota bacterium]
MNFAQKLSAIIKKNNSLLCVGLDPELAKFPKHTLKKKEPIFEFNKEIINATFDLVCTYKPNIAFYEAYGINGLMQLKKTIDYIRAKYTDIPVILDAKRADIGNTAKMYAKAMFEYWNADATTVYPYLGLDSILPFLEYKDKTTILLLKTSNPDAKMFQDLKVKNEPFYLRLAKTISKWPYKNIAVFVGATYPKELANVRKLFPNNPILTAGIGAQGAETQKAITAGIDKSGSNLICNNSRSILYTSSNDDFAKNARINASKMRGIINEYRL